MVTESPLLYERVFNTDIHESIYFGKTQSVLIIKRISSYIHGSFFDT